MNVNFAKAHFALLLMKNFDQITRNLGENAERLISKCESLNKGNFELRNEVDLLRGIISEKEREISELSEKNKIKEMAHTLAGGNGHSSKDVKLKINELVREIDKCIALLNK